MAFEEVSSLRLFDARAQPGLGLRSQHFQQILAENPKVGWFEIISENFMDSGGRPSHVLDRIVERYPIAMHGVSLSIGSTDPLNMEYLRRLKALANRVAPLWISDHLCWTGVHGLNSHDLLPMPLNDDSLERVIARVLQVQDYLQRPLVIENPSTYMAYQSSNLSEPEFLSTLVHETHCKLLLDVNNVWVSAHNLGFDPYAYVAGLPLQSVWQIHLAGHQVSGPLLIDTHDQCVTGDVWKLYHHIRPQVPEAAVMVEWDEHIPSFEKYWAESQKAFLPLATGDETEAAATSDGTAGAISTPVDFMVTKGLRI